MSLVPEQLRIAAEAQHFEVRSGHEGGGWIQFDEGEVRFFAEAKGGTWRVQRYSRGPRAGEQLQFETVDGVLEYFTQMFARWARHRER